MITFVNEYLNVNARIISCNCKKRKEFKMLDCKLNDELAVQVEKRQRVK